MPVHVTRFGHLHAIGNHLQGSLTISRVQLAIHAIPVTSFALMQGTLYRLIRSHMTPSLTLPPSGFSLMYAQPDQCANVGLLLRRGLCHRYLQISAHRVMPPRTSQPLLWMKPSQGSLAGILPSGTYKNS
jgi:hypothetical protein